MELELKNVSKSFGEKRVLDNICFTAHAGRAFGLLGRNGAGKTTTIRLIMDVFPADGGEILIDGKPIDYGKLGTGYLPEERGLYPRKRIDEQLLYFARLKGMNKPDAVKSIDYWLGRLGMAEYKDKKLQTLSKGNQQKIQLVTAVAHDPDLIVLDEPFSGLDPVNAGILKDVVNEEIEKGKIVLFSSHQMNYIEEFCDHIAILNGGKIALEGSLREIKRGYPRTTLFVRSPEIQKIAAAYGGAPEDDSLLLKLSSEDEKKSVMQKLSGAFEIDEMRVVEPSLGDIFVEYAGQSV